MFAWLSRHSQADSNVTGGDSAAAVLQTDMIAATLNIVRVIRALFISFCRCSVESKRGKICRVEYRQTALAILAALSASLVLADDFKTINGKEYKNATISRVEDDGIVLRTKSGISKVYFAELPKEVQERFHYDPAKVVAAQRQREQVALQAKQDARQQVDERRLSSTAAENDDAFPKKIFDTVIVLIVGIIIAAVAVFKKSFGS
jgi:hypothetical protein